MKDTRISLFEMVMCLSNATDLVSPKLAHHQKQVAYIAAGIAETLGLPAADRHDLIMAGALHDMGALSLKERLDSLGFENDGDFSHPEAGFFILHQFKPFSKIAHLVRHHHLNWEGGRGQFARGEEISPLCHLLHLADRIDVLCDPNREILSQVPSICRAISRGKGKRFVPEQIEAFLELAGKDYFWFDIGSPVMERLLAERCRSATVPLDFEGLTGLARLFSRTIDFRSRFTSVHSSGVAEVAEALARLAGMSEEECRMMRVAGYLHDFGKLALPSEILEKPEKLSEVEFNLVRRHTYYARRLLEPITELETITDWISYHHERIDGKGYPFGISGDRLPLGARVMAVADVFTAITEDRPYRRGMDSAMALDVLFSSAEEGALDHSLVELLAQSFEEINDRRSRAQEAALNEYQEFEKFAGASYALSA